LGFLSGFLRESQAVDLTGETKGALAPRNMKWVDDPAALRVAAAELSRGPRLYFDTEFDSGREGTRLCLVQLSAGKEVYLIDAIRLADLSPLAQLLSDAERPWVVHAGQQDVALLSAELGARPARVFDTQIAWSLITVEHSASLAYLKYRLLGLKGEKAHQADDWRRRPLPEAQLAYAASDVEDLPALYESLFERTQQLQRTEAVYAVGAENLLSPREAPLPLSLESFRNAWLLPHEGQAVLGFLMDWYNGLDEIDRGAAPDIKGLFAIAARRPKTLDELSSLRAVPRRTTSRFGPILVAGVKKAESSAHSTAFQPIEPLPYATAAELLIEGWLEAVRVEACVELGIAPEIGLPARLVRRMREAARANLRLDRALDVLCGWRRQLFFDTLSQKLGRYGPLPGTPQEVK
jgi:ribonuclease D